MLNGRPKTTLYDRGVRGLKRQSTFERVSDSSGPQGVGSHGRNRDHSLSQDIGSKNDVHGLCSFVLFALHKIQIYRQILNVLRKCNRVNWECGLSAMFFIL